MYIYLIQQENTNFYKIGVTKNINKRIMELQIGSGIILKLIYSFETKFGFKLEAALHAYFRIKRTNGEWFELDSDDVDNFGRVCLLQETNLCVLKDNNSFFI